MNSHDPSIRCAAHEGPLPQPSQNVPRPRLWVAALVAYAFVLGLPYLGSGPLMSHEVLVAERTQGLMTEGGWVVPYRNGEPDFIKPPLPFWLSGLASLAFGEVNEWAVRLPSLLATAGTMLVLVFYMRRLSGWRTALITGWVFLTSAAALEYSRRAEVDMLLTFWTTLSLVAYAVALGEPNRRRQVAWLLTMWLAAAIAVLAKGPLPIGILLVTMIVTAAFCPQGRRIGRMLPIAGPLLMLAVVAAWGLPVILKYPEALSTWSMQSLGRFAGQMGHEKPPQYYALHAPILWMPWILPVVVGAYLLIGRRKFLGHLHRVFLAAWGIGGLVLLSLSTGKRLHYALPVIPPFLVLAGIGLDHILFVVPRRLTRTQGVLLWLHVLAVPIILVGAFVGVARLPEHATALATLTSALAAGLCVALWLYCRHKRTAALLSVAVGFAAVQVAAMGLIVTPVSQTVGREAAIGRTIAAQPTAPVCVFVSPDNPVVASYSLSTVAFYAERRPGFVEGSEAMQHWRAGHPGGFVVAGKDDLPLLRQLGAWARPLPPEDPRWSESDFELLVVPPNAVAGSLVRSAAAMRPMEETHAK